MSSKPPVELRPRIGRRRDHHHAGVADLGRQLLLDRGGQPDCTKLRRRPLFPPLERQEDDPAVALIRRGDHIQSFEHDRVPHPLNPAAKRLDPLEHPLSRLAAGPVGCLDHRDQVALILRGDERLGTGVEQPSGQAQKED